MGSNGARLLQGCQWTEFRAQAKEVLLKRKGMFMRETKGIMGTGHAILGKQSF